MKEGAETALAKAESVLKQSGDNCKGKIYSSLMHIFSLVTLQLMFYFLFRNVIMTKSYFFFCTDFMFSNLFGYLAQQFRNYPV